MEITRLWADIVVNTQVNRSTQDPLADYYSKDGRFQTSYNSRPVHTNTNIQQEISVQISACNLSAQTNV